MMYMVDMGSNAIKDECKLEFHIEQNEKKSFWWKVPTLENEMFNL